MSRMGGDAGEDIRKPRLRVDAIHLCCLCRAPNYAESGRFPQISG